MSSIILKIQTVNDDDTGKQVNSIIPDLVTFTKSILADECALGGADHLIDVKTLAAGQCYQANSHNFGSAVEKRQVQVNTDYHATAKRLDTRLHGTPLGERGPFTRTLFEYGNRGCRVLGAVVGAFGEASTDLGPWQSPGPLRPGAGIETHRVLPHDQRPSAGPLSPPTQPQMGAHHRSRLVTVDSRSPSGLCGPTGNRRPPPLNQRSYKRRPRTIQILQPCPLGAGIISGISA